MAERGLRIPETRLTKDKPREDYGNEPGTVSPFANEVRDALVSVGAGAGEDLPAGFQRPLPDRNGAVSGNCRGAFRQERRKPSMRTGTQGCAARCRGAGLQTVFLSFGRIQMKQFIQIN